MIAESDSRTNYYVEFVIKTSCFLKVNEEKEIIQ